MRSNPAADSRLKVEPSHCLKKNKNKINVRNNKFEREPVTHKKKSNWRTEGLIIWFRLKLPAKLADKSNELTTRINK